LKPVHDVPRPPKLDYSSASTSCGDRPKPVSVGALAAAALCALPTALAVGLIVDRANRGSHSMAEGVATVVLLFLFAAPAFVVGVVVRSVVYARRERRGGWILDVALVALALTTLVRLLQTLFG
jgi:hypothetical protein